MSEIIDSDKIERHEMYTLWQKMPNSWVVERSYVGHYVLSTLWFGVKQSWKTSRPYGVFPQGVDPNQEEKEIKCTK